MAHHPAVAATQLGNWKITAPRQQVGRLQLNAHTTLKVRQPGQNAPDEVAGRDLKKELEAREGGAPLLLDAPAAAGQGGSVFAGVNLSQFDDRDDEDPQPRGGGDDDDDDDDKGNNEDEDEDEDEEAELLREVARIKKEREEARAREAAEKQAAEAERVMSGNPLLAAGAVAPKRKWDDDVVFKNQAKEEPKAKKRFINDALRSDFHREFLRRYCQ